MNTRQKDFLLSIGVGLGISVTLCIILAIAQFSFLIVSQVGLMFLGVYLGGLGLGLALPSVFMAIGITVYLYKGLGDE